MIARLMGSRPRWSGVSAKKIETTVSVDPQLIGRRQDRCRRHTVIDGSVQGELHALANHLRA